MKAWAPPGTTLVERLGTGSVFEVGVVRGEGGQSLLCKRVNPELAEAGEPALAREIEVLRACSAAHETRASVLIVPEWVGSGTDGRGAFLLETVAPGCSLREFVFANGRVLEPGLWLRMARSLTRALAELHALADASGGLDIVHGDVSPDNIFVEPPGRITFIDFSSATWRGAPKPALAHDRGTVPYAPPELVRGEMQANFATDTYALAATLLAAAMGSITDAGNDAGKLLETGERGLRVDRWMANTSFPEGVRAALAVALRFDPAQRTSSAAELAAALDAAK
ncbi:MAG TPA: phosphotransferase [Polyangiaceae bacterium]|nr:phosphotransferase [Polyangiaceae bacterium]